MMQNVKVDPPMADRSRFLHRSSFRYYVALVLAGALLLSSLMLSANAGQRQDPKSIETLLSLLKEADAVAKDAGVRSELQQASEAASRARKGREGSEEAAQEMHKALYLLRHIADDPRGESSDSQAKIAAALKLARDDWETPAVAPATAIYQKESPNLVAAQKQNFEEQMSKLKAFAEKFQPDMAAAQKKMGFDSQAMKAEFRAIAEEPDAAKRAQRAAEFQTRYEPQFISLAQTAGIDVAAQRQQMITLLGLPNARIKQGKTLAIIETAEDPPPTPMPTPTPPDVTERVLSAPFTSAGTTGDLSRADAATGYLYLSTYVYAAASIQKVAFISQTLAVDRGISRVRVSATLDPVSYFLNAGTVLAGYSSAEAIVNLRVMDGTRVVASDRMSLARFVTAVIGLGQTSGRRPVTLRTEFTRPAPDEATTYTLIAEIESWAGVGGFSNTTVYESADVQQFHVYLHRH